MSAPTLIGLPPPSSNPGTPSEMGPGTPNSTTTSLSALSTTAIKDGHQGNAPPHISSRHSHNTLAAERADRISRLAGLERVSTPPSGPYGPFATQLPYQQPGYFDNIQTQFRERSTVGSASATGSIGGRTTWASGSDAYDADKMSETNDDGVSSVGGLSDEGNASLVGFGEGASSTTSGPISAGRPPTSASGRQTSSGLSSPVMGKPSAIPPYMQQPASSPRHISGMTYDPDAVDTTGRSLQSSATYARNAGQTGTETAERIMRERVGEERGGGSVDWEGEGEREREERWERRRRRGQKGGFDQQSPLEER
ncbi:MAG: hypothetical protein M1839_000894 [Geoglossum umbratile]|nr:MAG: hypothetical protein M1839_000894 [Geoglossum umbratile]